MAIQTQEIPVKGMTCGHCEMTVSGAVQGLGEGIISATATKDKATVTVTFDDTKVTIEQVIAAVNETEIYTAG